MGIRTHPGVFSIPVVARNAHLCLALRGFVGVDCWCMHVGVGVWVCLSIKCKQAYLALGRVARHAGRTQVNGLQGRRGHGHDRGPVVLLQAFQVGGAENAQVLLGR